MTFHLNTTISFLSNILADTIGLGFLLENGLGSSKNVLLRRARILKLSAPDVAAQGKRLTERTVIGACVCA